MRTGRLEIEDALIGREFAVQEPGGILDEFDVGAVEFGESLLVFALHHDLRLGFERVGAVPLQVFDREGTFSRAEQEPNSAPVKLDASIG